ncbi:hypothetical protein OIU77_012449 [Salix suchowensis]|uniref:Uncharacterized protein n=1 Tax=Salix suchowensis TaxID=1278906 RepID=A0ABQ9A3U4_9ROSI|nr:hypothetical protein OIU77_012449 [Salix suchowensis]
MSISLNPVVGFKSTLQTKYHHVSRPNSMIQINGRRRGSFVSAVDNDRLVTDAIIKGHGGSESSIFDNQLPAMNSSIEDSPVGNNVGEESGPQTSGASNSSTISADMKSRPKRVASNSKRETKGC